MIVVESRGKLFCATRLKTARYADQVKTVCGYEVTFPYSVAEGVPNCPECKAVLKKKETQ